jgi:hypothetical protein
MPARSSLNASRIQSEPRYAATDALGLGWSGKGNQRGGAFGDNAGTRPVTTPVCLTHRIPSHTAGVLSP